MSETKIKRFDKKEGLDKDLSKWKDTNRGKVDSF